MQRRGSVAVVGAPLGAICGGYLRQLTLAWLVYFIDAAQLIDELAVVGPWFGEADGGNTTTPLHLCLTSAALFCDDEKEGNCGEEEPRTPRAIAAERHLEDQAEAEDGDDDDVVAWNMCQRVHKYGMWCDADCQALDTFRVDE